MSHHPTVSRRFAQLQGNWNCRLPMLAAIIGLLGLSLNAMEPSLGIKSISPAGNLLMEVRGETNSLVAIELSSTLNHWSPAATQVLTNGSATFYLRPSENQLFCRIKTLTGPDAPSPARFSPTLNDDFVKTAFFTDDGGSLALKDDNGVAYTLTLPEDSLIDNSTIRLQVVNETSGLPPGLSYLGGVMVEPAGLDVYNGSSLSLALPQGTDTNALAAIAWDSAGAELHLVPFRVEDLRVVIPLHRLGGFGVVQWKGGNITPLVQSKPTDAANQFDHQLAVAALPTSPFQQQQEASKSKQAELPCAQAAVWQIFLTARQNELQNALADDTMLETALHNYSPVDALDVAANQPCFAALLAQVDVCDGLAVAAVMSSIEREAEICRTRRDLKALVRLYRDGRLLKNGHWARRVTPEQTQHMRDLLHECLNFRVEFLSSTAAGSKAGVVRTSVSSDIHVRYNPVTDPAVGPGKFQIRGDSEISIDSTAWDNLAEPCTVTPAPASGKITVYHLSPQGLITDVKNLIIHTDDELPTPKFELYLDPFLPPPSENYTLTCPHTVPLKLEASFWGGSYGGLHKDEIQKQLDGKSVFVITDFRSPGKDQPFRKEYQREGKVDALNVSETTSVFIHYLGTGN